MWFLIDEVLNESVRLDYLITCLKCFINNAVGSFVWTHLTNLQETSSPSKQDIRHMLSSDFLRNKFNTDVRKFSRNFEASTFWDQLNVGATVESNVIFSSSSYLPRSGMLNLTLDLFGQSVNLFELGARIEGFESMIESFFGPNGVFPDKTLEKVLQKARGKREIDESLQNEVANSFIVNNHISIDQPQGIWNSFYLFKLKSFDDQGVLFDDTFIIQYLHRFDKSMQMNQWILFL